MVVIRLAYNEYWVIDMGVGSVLRSFCTKEVTPIPGTNVLWV